MDTPSVPIASLNAKARRVSLLCRSRNAGNLESLPQNIWQDIIAEMSQVLTVGPEPLAAGFATGNNYTRTADCNRRLPLDERAPNMPFELGLRIH